MEWNGTTITGSVQRTETEQSMIRFALPLESYVSTQHPSHNKSGANRIRPGHRFQFSLIDIYKDQSVNRQEIGFTKTGHADLYR